MPEQSPQPYIDDRELARRTGIAAKTWQRWRGESEGPPYSKLGRRVLYRWADVEAWIANRRVGA